MVLEGPARPDNTKWVLYLMFNEIPDSVLFPLALTIAFFVPAAVTAFIVLDIAVVGCGLVTVVATINEAS